MDRYESISFREFLKKRGVPLAAVAAAFRKLPCDGQIMLGNAVPRTMRELYKAWEDVMVRRDELFITWGYHVGAMALLLEGVMSDEMAEALERECDGYGEDVDDSEAVVLVEAPDGLVRLDRLARGPLPVVYRVGGSLLRLGAGRMECEECAGNSRSCCVVCDDIRDCASFQGRFEELGPLELELIMVGGGALELDPLWTRATPLEEL